MVTATAAHNVRTSSQAATTIGNNVSSQQQDLPQIKSSWHNSNMRFQFNNKNLKPNSQAQNSPQASINAHSSNPNSHLNGDVTNLKISNGVSSTHSKKKISSSEENFAIQYDNSFFFNLRNDHSCIDNLLKYYSSKYNCEISLKSIGESTFNIGIGKTKKSHALNVAEKLQTFLHNSNTQRSIFIQEFVWNSIFHLIEQFLIENPLLFDCLSIKSFDEKPPLQCSIYKVVELSYLPSEKFIELNFKGQSKHFNSNYNKLNSEIMAHEHLISLSLHSNDKFATSVFVNWCADPETVTEGHKQTLMNRFNCMVLGGQQASNSKCDLVIVGPAETISEAVKCITTMVHNSIFYNILPIELSIASQLKAKFISNEKIKSSCTFFFSESNNQLYLQGHSSDVQTVSEFIEELSYELLEDTLSQEFSIGYGEIDQILGGNISLIISTLNSMNLVGVTIDVVEKKGGHSILVSSDNAKNFDLACKEIKSFIQNNGLSVKLLTIDRDMRTKCKKIHQVSAIKYLLENHPKVSMIQMNEKSTNQDDPLEIKLTGPFADIQKILAKYVKLKADIEKQMYSEMIQFGKRSIEEDNYVREIDVFSFEGLYKKLIIFVAEKSVSLFLRQNQGIVLEGSKDTVLKSISNIIDFYDSVSRDRTKISFDILLEKRDQFLQNAEIKRLVNGKAYFSFNTNQADAKKGILDVYAHANDAKTIRDTCAKVIDSLQDQQLKEIDLTKEQYMFIVEEFPLKERICDLPGIFYVFLNVNKKNQTYSLAITGKISNDFNKSIARLEDMLTDPHQISLQCSEHAAKHLQWGLSPHNISKIFEPLYKEAHKLNSQIFIFHLQQKMVIRGKKSVLEKMQPKAKQFLDSITVMSKNYPSKICGIVIGMNATTKLTLQQKFDISINVTDIKVSSQTNQGTISAYGTEKNCQKFYEYIDSQYKGLEVEVPAILMGKIYGKNGETLQLLKNKNDVRIQIISSQNPDMKTVIICGNIENSNKTKEDIMAIVSANKEGSIPIPAELQNFVTYRRKKWLQLTRQAKLTSSTIRDGAVIIRGTKEQIEIGVKLFSEWIDNLKKSHSEIVNVPKDICGKMFGRGFQNIYQIENKYGVEIHSIDDKELNQVALHIFAQNVSSVENAHAALETKLGRIVNPGADNAAPAPSNMTPEYDEDDNFGVDIDMDDM